MPIFVCDPPEIVNAGAQIEVRMNIRTQGDWRKTKEGHDALEAAQVTLAQSKAFPPESLFQFHGNDDATFSVFCSGQKEAEIWRRDMISEVPKLLRAVYNDVSATRGR